MRQYMLAAYCKIKMTELHQVDLAIIGFRGNRNLLRVPRNVRHLGMDVVSAWNGMLDTAPPFRLVFVEDVLASAPDNDWRRHVTER